MTADSQLISGKVIRAIARRGFAPVLQGDRRISRSLERLDGEFFKRLFDILFSLSVLILFAPVYLLLALSIALSSSGPIFYVQERVGKNRKMFYCLKFRTMVENADEVSNVICFVASPEAVMMNGSVITVDGGASVVDLPTLAFYQPPTA